MGVRADSLRRCHKVHAELKILERILNPVANVLSKCLDRENIRYNILLADENDGSAFDAPPDMSEVDMGNSCNTPGILSSTRRVYSPKNLLEHSDSDYDVNRLRVTVSWDTNNLDEEIFASWIPSYSLNLCQFQLQVRIVSSRLVVVPHRNGMEFHSL